MTQQYRLLWHATYMYMCMCMCMPKKIAHLNYLAAVRRQAIAAAMAAPRPEPPGIVFILILFLGASSSSANFTLYVIVIRNFHQYKANTVLLSKRVNNY